jgi:hypothetical protein
MNKNMMPKNNPELQTKWVNTSWKTFEETIRGYRNRSINAQLVTDGDDNTQNEKYLRLG